MDSRKDCDLKQNEVMGSKEVAGPPFTTLSMVGSQTNIGHTYYTGLTCQRWNGSDNINQKNNFKNLLCSFFLTTD